MLCNDPSWHWADPIKLGHQPRFTEVCSALDVAARLQEGTSISHDLSAQKQRLEGLSMDRSCSRITISNRNHPKSDYVLNWIDCCSFPTKVQYELWIWKNYFVPKVNFGKVRIDSDNLLTLYFLLGGLNSLAFFLGKRAFERLKRRRVACEQNWTWVSPKRFQMRTLKAEAVKGSTWTPVEHGLI